MVAFRFQSLSRCLRLAPQLSSQAWVGRYYAILPRHKLTAQRQPPTRGNMSASTPGRAIVVESFGDPSVLRVKDITTPAPGPGEVLVHVEAAGVNPVDTYIRSGTYAAGPSPPYIPGKDGAGTVLAVGPDVTTLQVGNRVYLTTSVTGTYATHCIAKASHAHRLPDNVDFLKGACVGVPYHTAYRGLFQKGQAKEGSKVFIHGASGGVGLAATQLAKAKGCLVVGSAGTSAGMELVKKNGANEAVCHREDGYLDKAQQLAPDGYNVILEMLANQNLENDFRIAAKAAHIAIIGNRGSITINPRSIMAKELHVDGVMLYAATEEEEKEAAADIFKVLSSGAAPVVAKNFTLEDAPEAHEQVISHSDGAAGNLVIVPGAS